jgi:hexosaminidase
MLLLVTAARAQPIWPAPQAATWGNHSRILAPGFEFTFGGVAASTAAAATPSTPSTLVQAFSRYGALARPRRWANTTRANALKALSVTVASTDEAPPQLDTDETYTLIVGTDGNAALHAKTVYGALRGLESFRCTPLATLD